jgi:hypothetical protein
MSTRRLGGLQASGHRGGRRHRAADSPFLPLPSPSLQKQVLSLYRDLLRAARHKPADARAGIEALARSEYERWRHLPRSELNRIEHLLRRGRRQAEMLGQSDVQGFGMVEGGAGTGESGNSSVST